MVCEVKAENQVEKWLRKMSTVLGVDGIGKVSAATGTDKTEIKVEKASSYIRISEVKHMIDQVFIES